MGHNEGMINTDEQRIRSVTAYIWEIYSCYELAFVG